MRTTKKNRTGESVPQILDVLCQEFSTIIDIDYFALEKDIYFLEQCTSLANYLSKHTLLPFEERKSAFLAHVNCKFRVNAEHLAVFYKQGAKLAHTFNYHQKGAIQLIFNRGELDKLSDLLLSFNLKLSTVKMLISCAACASVSHTQNIIHAELNAPSKLRREVGTRDLCQEILKALFASFLWVSLPPRDMHRFFDSGFEEKNYHESFWEELQQRSPRLFHRDEAVHFLAITQKWSNQFTNLESLRDAALTRVRDCYEQLNNYGFLVVLIQPATFEGRDISWEIASDITIFGEKHVEYQLNRAYFRHKLIQETTLDYIPEIKPHKAKFELVNEGFSYRDCFILTDQKTQELNQLLILQKNHRDETAVNCPTCRSGKVEGNSYPSLGVKSWECSNPLCPDRSKYNRGKRYSFRSLAMQQAIDDERNNIPTEFVRRWLRDVVEIAGYDDVLEMIVRHYSIWGDQIRCFGELPHKPSVLLGRVLHWDPMPILSDGNTVEWFGNAALFQRYGIMQTKKTAPQGIQLCNDDLKVYCGDSRYVLKDFESCSIDGAVTSPPYYNAREYSQWPNIYCYLQDMFEVNTQVFRILKEGSLYFFNIFDYFDNENTTALSAMGQKRIPLSAYTVDSFRRIGFELIGNVVWDKGEIEGKRGFNAGNFSPFYQSPFNCWEHVLVFRKPGGKSPDFGGSRVLPAKPVIKMVKGQNTYGHTAPFPEDIPNLCIEIFPKGSSILDPFAGSLTTGRAAVAKGRRAICIENSREFCNLGLNMYSASIDRSYLKLVI